MAIVNHAKKEINAKIVYYGHEGAGKGTSLRYVFDRIRETLRGKLKVQPTAGSTLLFFDFSPFEQPVFAGYRIRFHIYTLQGNVANPAAWKMTLKGADGLVFVADVSPDAIPAAQQSLAQLRIFLNNYGVALHDVPLVLQLNKADRAGQVSAPEISSALGLEDCNVFLTTATTGEGVLETLSHLSREIMQRVRENCDVPQEEEAMVAENSPETGSCDFRTDTVVAPELPVAEEQTVECLLEEETVSAGQTGADTIQINVADAGVSIDGGTVRIPLDISQAGGVRRLVLTVAVEPG